MFSLLSDNCHFVPSSFPSFLSLLRFPALYRGSFFDLLSFVQTSSDDSLETDFHSSLFDLFSLHSNIEQIELPLSLEQIDSGLQSHVFTTNPCIIHRFPFTSMSLVLPATDKAHNSIFVLAVQAREFLARLAVLCSFSQMMSFM